MPGGVTGHLRSVVRNQDAVEVILLEDLQDTKHVDVAVVHERFFIERNFAGDVSEMDVSQFLLAAILIDNFVNVAVGHFRKRAEAEFKLIGRARMQIEEAMVVLRLIDKSRLTTHGLHGWVVGVCGEFHSSLFGDWKDFG